MFFNFFTILRELKELRKRVDYLISFQEANKLKFIVGEQEKESMIISAVQKFTATVVPVDVKGNPATVDGVPSWSVDNVDLLDLVVSGDGLSATISAKGPLGSTQVNVTADADLGEGVKTITGILTVEVKGAEAVGFIINTTEPVNQ